MRIPACFEDKETRPLIEDICQKNRIDIQLLEELSEAIQKYAGSGRKEGVTSDIATCIDNFLQRSSSDT